MPSALYGRTWLWRVERSLLDVRCLLFLDWLCVYLFWLIDHRVSPSIGWLVSIVVVVIVVVNHVDGIANYFTERYLIDYWDDVILDFYWSQRHLGQVPAAIVADRPASAQDSLQ
jgi:hypothetical protein